MCTITDDRIVKVYRTIAIDILPRWLPVRKRTPPPVLKVSRDLFTDLVRLSAEGRGQFNPNQEKAKPERRLFDMEIEVDFDLTDDEWRIE